MGIITHYLSHVFNSVRVGLPLPDFLLMLPVSRNDFTNNSSQLQQHQKFFHEILKDMAKRTLKTEKAAEIRLCYVKIITEM
jgi:hypothetical protein